METKLVTVENKSIIDNLRKKDWISTIQFAVTTKTFIVILIAGGLVGYILTQNSLNMSIAQSATTIVPITLPSWYNVLLEILKLLSGTAITTGILSLFLRISSMKSNISDIVIDTYDDFKKSILKIDFDLNGYDNNTLDQLQKRIVLHKNQNKIMTIDSLNESIYALEENLSNLTNGLFWDYHERTTIITPDKKNNIFKFRQVTEYNVTNLYGLENKIEFSLSVLKGTNISEDNIKISHFQINNTDLSNEVKNFQKIEEISESHYSPYSHMLKFKRDLQRCREHIVKYTYEYDVPMFDVSHTYRLSKPCKKLNHTILLGGTEASEWSLDVNAFTSWYYDTSELKKNYQVLSPISNSAQINFNYWSLPGAGYVIVLNKNQ